MFIHIYVHTDLDPDADQEMHTRLVFYILMQYIAVSNKQSLYKYIVLTTCFSVIGPVAYS